MQWASYSAATIDAAKAAGKPAIIDFFADWCAPCRRLDEETFTDPRVVEQFKSFVAVKANLTRDDPQATALRRQYDVRGVPVIVFLGPDGQERRGLRLNDWAPPNEFLELMKKAASPGSSVAQR